MEDNSRFPVLLWIKCCDGLWRQCLSQKSNSDMLKMAFCSSVHSVSRLPAHSAENGNLGVLLKLSEFGIWNRISCICTCCCCKAGWSHSSFFLLECWLCCSYNIPLTPGKGGVYKPENFVKFFPKVYPLPL